MSAAAIPDARYGKLAKLLAILLHGPYRRALLRTRTAAAIEHEAVLAFIDARTVIDVGANKGQFSLAARRMSPAARIIAFEALPEASETYRRTLDRGAARLHQVALSDKAGHAAFYVADRADSSSLLQTGPGQTAVFGVSTSGRIEVETQRLDAVLAAERLESPVVLKIDVQGAELMVLEGAEALLPQIDYVYVECSYVELYSDQALLSDVKRHLESRGFALLRELNVHRDPVRGPVQADCLFGRASS